MIDVEAVRVAFHSYLSEVGYFPLALGRHVSNDVYHDGEVEARWCGFKAGWLAAKRDAASERAKWNRSLGVVLSTDSSNAQKEG